MDHAREFVTQDDEQQSILIPDRPGEEKKIDYLHSTNNPQLQRTSKAKSQTHQTAGTEYN